MRKIAVCLSKGGVGKTTTATTLAHGLSLCGQKVLLVDCDTQGQAAFFLGAKCELGLAEVILKQASIDDAVCEVRPNLHLLAGGRSLADASMLISKRTMGIERALIEALASVENKYAVIILDMAPGWDILSVNALMFANEILSPVELQMPAVESLAQFMERIEDIQAYNPKLSIKYLLPTMWDKRSKESSEILNQLKKLYPKQVCTPIRSSVRFFEATNKGETILEYAGTSQGALDYQALINRVKSDN